MLLSRALMTLISTMYGMTINPISRAGNVVFCFWGLDSRQNITISILL